MTYWKALNGRTPTVGNPDYRYPVDRWTRHLDPARLQACEYGYHLARDKQILEWLAPTLYTAEPCPDHPLIEAADKVVTCRTRITLVAAWNDRTARMFAADCAEHALEGEREAGREPDARSWAAVEAARLYANGEIGDAAGAAARDAAWAAAGDAAWTAARDAARDWQYGRLLHWTGVTP